MDVLWFLKETTRFIRQLYEKPAVQFKTIIHQMVKYSQGTIDRQPGYLSCPVAQAQNDAGTLIHQNEIRS